MGLQEGKIDLKWIRAMGSNKPEQQLFAECFPDGAEVTVTAITTAIDVGLPVIRFACCSPNLTREERELIFETEKRYRPPLGPAPGEMNDPARQSDLRRIERMRSKRVRQLMRSNEKARNPRASWPVRRCPMEEYENLGKRRSSATEK